MRKSLKHELGGAMTTQLETSGVAHLASRDDAECLAIIRELMIGLSSVEESGRPAATRGSNHPPRSTRAWPLNSLVPEDPLDALRTSRMCSTPLPTTREFLRGPRALSPKRWSDGYARLDGGARWASWRISRRFLAGVLDISAVGEGGATFVRFCHALPASRHRATVSTPIE